MKNTIEEIEQAKQLLKANGYFTGNLEQYNLTEIDQ
jgi:hypothetical protein